MRALLLCPKSAHQTASHGQSTDEIMNAFISEVDIDNDLYACSSVLSTDDRQVVTTEVFGPLDYEGNHFMVFDKNGLIGSPQHFIYAWDEELRGFFAAGRCLITGPADDEGNLTAATMTVEETIQMFRYANATGSGRYLAYDEFNKISSDAYETLASLPAHPDPGIDDAINKAVDAVGRVTQLTFGSWM